MSLQPDEKKTAILAILDQLRLYKPAIGSYVISIYTTDFDYSVKLSNGRIRLPEELVDDFEQAPGFIFAERFRTVAGRFVPNEPEVVVPVAQPTQAVSAVKTKNSLGSWLTIAGALLVVFLACQWYRGAQKDQALASARANIYGQVSVESSDYMVNRLLGGISDLRITVTNNSGYLVDIVRVKVTYIKANGAIYKNEVLYFNQLGAHSTQTLNAPNSDRGTKVQITTESLTCTALQLN